VSGITLKKKSDEIREYNLIKLNITASTQSSRQQEDSGSNGFAVNTTVVKSYLWITTTPPLSP
jgi:hypothetical protein